ncbi:hypothetical protein TPHA_0I01470 [Tetrapisispora phaffii CBS 4417]|uniref:DNA mismatch repair proteins mutS family domain-containing protein n=1 Tax=Tetrapisispora phaffii (strain ATCC 24235 / CBS 4417 / NBRC 1672 / NRRL Y-8282 / UCD 70-5) TaxID=1071381 RepID=G8BXM5_TETPH|nr:hypothetical protein TPHA_0I01470 [Tetrapisispora phaffii CBS 4417]CCE64653.1 hypothetical protein TPHA_0I01470 [Tetrapisispora phaffii CBS 4417]
MYRCITARLCPYRSIIHYRNFAKVNTKPSVSKIKIQTTSPKLNAQNKLDSYINTTNTLPDLNKDIATATPDVDEKLSDIPPSLKYVRELIDHHKGSVVLTQMGSFYELYFEQAEKYAPELNIQLTSKQFSHGKVPFAGFPVGQLSRHLKVLVNDHEYSVAIAQQFKKDGVADNEVSKFYRRVTRIVTPGTFIDEAFENFEENNYLLSINFPENCFNKLADSDSKLGLSWCDVSTGEIFVQQVRLKDAVSAITRIQPKEILLEESIADFTIESGSWYPEFVELKKYFLKYHKLPAAHITLDSLYSLFANGTEESTSRLFKIQFQTFTQKELAALRDLLIYIKEHLPDFRMNLQFPQKQSVTSIMQIDSRTSSALELHATVRDRSKKGSLLSCIRRTVTSPGTRLLSQWLSGPSLDLAEINSRQDIVAFFLEDLDSTKDMISNLKTVSDLTRIIQRFSFNQGDASELLQLVESLKTAKAVKKNIETINSELEDNKLPDELYNRLISDLEFDGSLISEVESCINEVALRKINSATSEGIEKDESMNSSGIHDTNNEIWIIDPNYNNSLKKYHEEYQNCKREKEKLQEIYNNKLVNDIGCRRVAMKQKPNGDYTLHIHASTNNMKKVLDFINTKELINGHPLVITQKSVQTCWVSHKSWNDLAHLSELAKFRIKQEEDFILNNLKTKFVNKSESIRLITHKLAYIDVLSSFAILATDNRLKRPKLNNTTSFNIKGGRHLMVEEGLKISSLSTFVKNDCKLAKGDLWVITGPNMGGKSTFLRQNATIIILAQIGSYCPCDKATIGLVDKIFSRVGSADDLYNEMSTFMVEMIETSYILHGATNRSLAILDEIGRGTSSKEGTSIAFATLKYLIEKNSCRTLFATHFGSELKEIIDKNYYDSLKNNLKFYETSVVEISEDNYYYDHKLKEGVCTKSDAIKVAKRAGFPETALNDAKRFLN